MKYEVLTWHTCTKVPKKFWDMCEDGAQSMQLDLTAGNFNEVMELLKDHNIMILNDSKTIYIDSRRFRQS